MHLYTEDLHVILSFTPEVSHVSEGEDHGDNNGEKKESGESTGPDGPVYSRLGCTRAENGRKKPAPSLSTMHFSDYRGIKRTSQVGGG